MGWKLWLLVLAPTDDATTVTSHLMGKAMRTSSESTIERILTLGSPAVAPLKDHLLFSSNEVVEQVFADVDGFTRRLKAAQVGSAWAFILHGASNTYGWARFENAQCVRFVYGNAETRVERGATLPMEQSVLTSLGLALRPDGRFVDSVGQTRTHDQLGEERVLGLMTAVLGLSPESDQFMGSPTLVLTPADGAAAGSARGEATLAKTARLLKWEPAAVTRHWAIEVQRLKDAIAQGRVELPGIMVLMPKRRDPREAKDPRTGQSVTIPGSVSVTARFTRDWQDRDLDAPPPVPQMHGPGAFLEALAATLHAQFHGGTKEVTLPGLGQISVERVPGQSATNPRTGATVTIPGANRWHFQPDEDFVAVLK